MSKTKRPSLKRTLKLLSRDFGEEIVVTLYVGKEGVPVLVGARIARDLGDEEGGDEEQGVTALPRLRRGRHEIGRPGYFG